MAKNPNGLTPDYIRTIGNKQVSKKYKDCLAGLISGLIAHNPKNIESILLYGGIVRDSKVFDEWSDIDIIVIFRDITKRNALDLAILIHRLENEYSIRIDLTQISLREITNEKLAKWNTNSEIVNALSMRENVSIVVYGHLPELSFTTEQEKQAAIYYIMNTLGLFRKYLVEVVYRDNLEEHIRTDLKRISRWMFSIIRASLRLFDIYAHPYQYSLEYMERVFPEVDTSLPKQLIEMRENYNKVEIPLEIIHEIEVFIENYVVLTLERYYDEAEGHR